MGRMKLGGVVAATSGALLVVALLLPWWGYPSAFDNPAELPADAQTAAEFATDSGQSPEADAFEFFETRDKLLLAAGLIGFGFGLSLLALGERLAIAAKMAVGAVSLIAVVLMVVTLISPPDYADLGPPGKPPVDFGVSLPLDPQVGVFVALAAAIGLLVGVGLSLKRPSGTTATVGEPST